MGREILPHERDLRIWLQRRLVSAADVEDVVQECYCRLAQLSDVAHVTLPNTVSMTGSRGNPNLRPCEAKQADATLEWYFAPASSLTAAAFYKKADSFTVTTVNREFVPGFSERFGLFDIAAAKWRGRQHPGFRDRLAARLPLPSRALRQSRHHRRCPRLRPQREQYRDQPRARLSDQL